MSSSGKLLAGKWCIVTGGGKGIGAAIAETFAAEGANVALVARSKESLDKVAKTCKDKGAPEVSTYSVDLGDLASLDKFAKAFQSDHAHCNVLVNCAGVMGQGSPTEGDTSQWVKCIQLNLLAPMALTKAFSPAMVEKKEGLIINLGSVAALEPMKSTPVYAASKWGIRGWSLSCYEALRQHNVKVVCIHPAAVNTPMTEGMFVPERCLQPSDIAEAAMLAVRTSSACVPSEITLRLTLSAVK
ncbi:hypothetical protein ABBQ32_006307 [Trebouxia sp. C0010 RCD-2024]